MVTTEKRMQAVSDYFDVSLNDWRVSLFEDNSFSIPSGREYLVLTEEEANDKVKENILDSVWAFHPNFLVNHIKEGVPVKFIEAVQEKLCDDANVGLKALLNDEDEFVTAAVAADGRGHFLSGYDGRECYHQGFYIYRTN